MKKASESPDVAERICDELLEFTRQFLARLPKAGALLEEGREFGAREIYKHGYRLIYVQSGGDCLIVRCIHSSRDLARELYPSDWPAIDWNPEDN